MTDVIILPKRRMERRNTAAALALLNEVLLDGEWCLETDTRKVKFGDGVTAYNSLLYVGELANLGNPIGDRLVYWDDTVGRFAFLSLGTGLTIGSGGDLDVAASDPGNQNANYVWAGPVTGSPGAVTFRALVNADIPSALTGKTYNGLGLAHNGAGTFTIEEPFSLHLLTVSDSTTLNGGTFIGNSSGTNTGDQTITLTGDVTGSGTGTFSATLGTVSSGKGGTGFTTYATGDIIYASATNVLSKLAAGTNTYVLTMVAGVPTWAAPGASGQSSIQFKDEGSALGASGTADTVDFVGAGVTATRAANVVTVTIAGGGGISSGTSNPGSPATNDIFYRTDLGLLIYYDGTRWLTVAEYSMHLSSGLSAGSGFVINSGEVGGFTSVRRDFGVYLTRFTCHSRVITTNTGSAYWTVVLQWISSAVALTTLVTFNTSADAANTIVDHSANINAVLNSGAYQLITIGTKTGAPGSLNVPAIVLYRLVVT